MAFRTRRCHAGWAFIVSNALATAPQSATRGVLPEGESVAPARLRVEVSDGVSEAAGVSHDGDSPVAQADHLAEAARLVAGGHEEEIRACVDEVGQRIVEPQEQAQLIRILLGEP